MKHLLVAVCVVGWLSAGNVALAEPSETDRNLAQSLFDQGKRLMAAGDVRQACPKLQESQRLDPSGGTLLNLALCHEKEGKLATAWTEFREALSVARREGRKERMDAAQEHMTALEPKVPWLTLTVQDDLPGQELRLDGVILGKAAWGSPLSVDPGSHKLTATAPGKKTWLQTLTLAEGQKQSLIVPELEDAPPGQSSSATAPGHARPAPPARKRTAGFVVGGAGVVALGVGAFFGFRTLSQKEDSDRLCPTDTTCSGEGASLNSDAHTSAWVSNIGIGLGLVGIGVGTYLVLSGGKPDADQARSRRLQLAVNADATPGGGRVQLRGAW